MRDQLLVFVKDVAFDATSGPAGTNHPCLSAKRRLPNRP
jgi:hypothetical protein